MSLNRIAKALRAALVVLKHETPILICYLLLWIKLIRLTFWCCLHSFRIRVFFAGVATFNQFISEWVAKRKGMRWVSAVVAIVISWTKTLNNIRKTVKSRPVHRTFVQSLPLLVQVVKLKNEKLNCQVMQSDGPKIIPCFWIRTPLSCSAFCLEACAYWVQQKQELNLLWFGHVQRFIKML